LSEVKKEEEKEAPFTIDEQGQVHCKWPGCSSIFPGDPSGMKAWANHWAAHTKRGMKEEAEGLTPKELSILVGVKERYDEDRKKAVLKTIDQILSDINQIFEVYVPPLDCKIRYGRMRVDEFMALKDLSEEDYIRQALFLMWRKGDESVSLEKIKQFTLEEIRQIYFYIVENTPFLFRATGTESSSEPQKSKPSS